MSSLFQSAWIVWLPIALATVLLLWWWLRRPKRRPLAEPAPPAPYVPGVTIRAGSVPGTATPAVTARERIEAFLEPGEDTAAVARSPASIGMRRETTTPAQPGIAGETEGREPSAESAPEATTPECPRASTPQFPSSDWNQTEATASSWAQEGLPGAMPVAYDLPFLGLGGEAAAGYFPDGAGSAAEQPSDSEEAASGGGPIAWLLRPENLALAILASEILRRPACLEHPSGRRSAVDRWWAE